MAHRFHDHLSELLLLKATVGAGESVHGGGGTRGGLESASPAPVRNFPGYPPPPLPLVPQALPMELLALWLFCICQFVG